MAEIEENQKKEPIESIELEKKITEEENKENHKDEPIESIELNKNVETNLKNEETEKEELIKEILKIQEEFTNLTNESQEVSQKNASLKAENEMYEEYIDNLMERINKIDPEILSKKNKSNN